MMHLFIYRGHMQNEEVPNPIFFYTAGLGNYCGDRLLWLFPNWFHYEHVSGSSLGQRHEGETLHPTAFLYVACLDACMASWTIIGLTIDNFLLEVILSLCMGELCNNPGVDFNGYIP